jgi:hypothetical protein
LDLVVARCLAKKPQDRFASCEELAKSLYPFTRSRPRTPVIKKNSWWSAPVRHREVWITVSACLLLAMFIQIPRALNAHYGVPPAPARQYFHPGVPYEALTYSPQTVGQTTAPDANDDATPRIEDRHSSPREIRVQKIALAELNKPAVSRNFSSDSSLASVRSPQSNIHNP